MGRHFPFLLKTNLLLFTLITLSPGCSQTQMFYIFAERMLLNRIDNYFNLRKQLFINLSFSKSVLEFLFIKFLKYKNSDFQVGSPFLKEYFFS